MCEGVGMKKLKNNNTNKVSFFSSLKSKKNKIKNKIQKNIKSFIQDPKSSMKKLYLDIKDYTFENKYFCIFLVTNLLSGILLRVFTVGGLNNAFAFSPFVADLSMIIVLGSIGYLMKQKNQIIYYVVLSFIFMLTCTINSAYYSYYTSFASVSLISTTKFVFAVGDAVVKQVLRIKDIVYILLFVQLIVVYIIISKKKKYKNANKKLARKTFLYGVFTTLLFALTLTGTDISRLVKQWNREYIVTKYGIYIYQTNDIIKSLEPKLTSLFGYDEALKTFNEYFENYPTENKKNEFTNKYKDMNIIGIHAESIQNFVINLKINGQEVTPNLNKLVKKSLYFDNFYSQVSVGTSSDTEFTLATSLMPSNTGTAFGNYFDNKYIAMPALLKEKGYYTFAMHGNNADYWNRRVMHKNLGYDHFYAKSEFNIDEWIGLGLSDVSFFNQSIEKLKVINNEHDKYYGTFIMLTNHTPFAELDKYGEFDVSMTVNGVKYPYMEDTKLGNYFKSVHYADMALGRFIDALEKNGLMNNTVFVLYGDHDARLPIEDYQRFYNYDYKTNGILPSTSRKYVDFDEYSYELNRKVPLLIYSKNTEPKKVSSVMGMYDLMPTLGNMFGFKNEYALGNDIFNHLNDNIVVFPTGNWLTNKVYYNNQKNEYLVLKGSVISKEYIDSKCKYSDDLLGVSNSIIIYDLIKNIEERSVDESKVINTK